MTTQTKDVSGCPSPDVALLRTAGKNARTERSPSPVLGKTVLPEGRGARQVLAEPPPQPPEPACQASDSPRVFHGFYRDDPWPKGDVVLTFDDGPHPTITPKVLTLLAERQMPAVFFVVGRNINSRTFHLLQRMVAEGHELGSHSYNHDIRMAGRAHGERTIEYIRGQHEVTRILIELALLAESPDDFNEIYTRVFDEDPARYLPSNSLRTKWSEYVERHTRVLSERGMSGDEWPYPLVYSRPPGGGPYLGGPSWSRKLYDEALRRVGLLNVMWHGGSGDVHPERRRDFAFLANNMRRVSQRGGVLLIHDYIRRDALASALDRMANDDNVRVSTLAEAVERKFGCPAAAVSGFLSRGSRALANERPPGQAVTSSSAPSSSATLAPGVRSL